CEGTGNGPTLPGASTRTAMWQGPTAGLTAVIQGGRNLAGSRSEPRGDRPGSPSRAPPRLRGSRVRARLRGSRVRAVEFGSGDDYRKTVGRESLLNQHVQRPAHGMDQPDRQQG